MSALATSGETTMYEHEEDWDYDDGYDCPHCDDGVLLVCIDDMCHGQGWCMHGDGEVMCPHCNGTGVLPAGVEGRDAAEELSEQSMYEAAGGLRKW